MSRYVYDVNGNILNTGYAIDNHTLTSVYDINNEEIYFDEPTPPIYPTPPDPEYLLDTAVLTVMPSGNITGIKQGACTDDEYIYQICFDSSAYTSGKFVKYKISDGTHTETTFDGSIDFGHGNDMLYNPITDHIYVATMKNDGSVIELTKNFEYVRTLNLINYNGQNYAVWQFCYNRNTNRIYSTHGSKMNIYDSSFNYLSAMDMPADLSATAQGCETDGKYIYKVTYNPNYFQVMLVDGSFVKTITNPATAEPEDLIYNWTEGKYYLNRHNANSATFSQVQLFM